MRLRHVLILSALAAFPAAAGATCTPAFVQGPGTVVIRPLSLDTGQASERFELRVRNDGDSACSLRLVVGRDLAARSADFPAYSMSGPFGTIAINAGQAMAGQGAAAAPVQLAAGAQIVLSHDVRVEAGWGSAAGEKLEELQFALLSAEDQSELATLRVRLRLEIPTTALIRFAGASSGGPARVDMGTLSPTSPTRSPPFAIRVLSTAPYRMDLESENRGALARIGGPDRAPYRLSVGGQAMNLRQGTDGFLVSRHTGRTGDVHAVSIIVDPDPLRHAGRYSDRIMVAVTPL